MRKILFILGLFLTLSMFAPMMARADDMVHIPAGDAVSSRADDITKAENYLRSLTTASRATPPLVKH